MLRIELSALSPQELKRLLDQARARNQSALAEQLLAELDARPSGAEAWRSTPLPMSWTPTYDDLLEPEPEVARSRRSGVMAVTAVIAAVVSAAVTWGISIPPEHPATEAPRAAVILASVAPVGPRAPPAEREEETPPVKVASLRPTQVAAQPRRENPCYDLATAAQRLVCGYPSLAIRDREMRLALDRARASGGDLRALEAEQVNFRAASDDVTDYRSLAELYDRRIRQIDEATARARATEPLF